MRKHAVYPWRIHGANCEVWHVAESDRSGCNRWRNDSPEVVLHCSLLVVRYLQIQTWPGPRNSQLWEACVEIMHMSRLPFPHAFLADLQNRPGDQIRNYDTWELFGQVYLINGHYLLPGRAVKSYNVYTLCFHFLNDAMLISTNCIATTWAILVETNRPCFNASYANYVGISGYVWIWRDPSTAKYSYRVVLCIVHSLYNGSLVV